MVPEWFKYQTEEQTKAKAAGSDFILENLGHVFGQVENL